MAEKTIKVIDGDDIERTVRVWENPDGSYSPVNRIDDAPSIESRLEAIETALTNGTAITKLSGSNAAEGAAPPSTLVGVAGRYDATPRSLGNGQLGALAISPEGRLITETKAQAYRLWAGQVITAGATVKSAWVDINGYGNLGVFIEFTTFANFEYSLEVSPVGGTPYTLHEDFTSAWGAGNKSLSKRHLVGHAQYLRLCVKNPNGTDSTMGGAWLQLIF